MTEVVTALLAVSITMDLLLWLWEPYAAPTFTIWVLNGGTCVPQQSALVCVRILHQGQYTCLCAGRQLPCGIPFRLHICTVSTIDF